MNKGRLLVCLAFLLAVCNAIEYDNCKILSKANQFQLEWKIVTDTLYFRLSSNPLSHHSTTWLGFGFASTNSYAMVSNNACSDIMMASSGTTCPTVTPAKQNCVNPECTICVDDLWVCSKPPSTDQSGTYLLQNSRDTTQSYSIDTMTSTTEMITLEGHRLLDTGDAQDLSITPGTPQYIIWALGEINNQVYLKHQPNTRGSLLVDFGAQSFCNDTGNDVDSALSFMSPDGDYEALWGFNSDQTEITFQVTVKTEGWAAIGFSKHENMLNSDVVIAYMDDQNVLQIYDGYISERVAPPADTTIGGTSDIKLASGSKTTTNGVSYLTFQFTRKLDTGDSKDVKIENVDDLHLLYAYGPIDTDGGKVVLQEHTVKGNVQMDFFKGVKSASGVSALAKLHGLFMILGWVIFLGGGAIVAHKYRPFTTKWFYIHVSLQVIGSLLVVIGFAMILADHQGEFHNEPHNIIGAIVFTFMLLQIVLGIISNRVESVRHQVHIVHRWVGRIVMILAFVNIMLGFSAASTKIANYIIAAIWFVFVLLIPFFIPLKSPTQNQDTDMDAQESDLKNVSVPTFTLASKVLLAVYFVFSTILAIVLIAILYTSPNTGNSAAEVGGSQISINAPSIYVRFNNYSIPSRETSYMCMSYEFVGTNQRDAIKISPVINNLKVAHHMILFQTDAFVESDDPVWDCTNMPDGKPVWLWAVGGGDFILPEGVGLRFGKDAIQYGVLQIHYDLSWSTNIPATKERDSSGLKIIFSENLQDQEMSNIRFGVPFPAIQIPPNEPNFQMSNTCPSHLTSQIPFNINIFSIALHMHFLGKTISFDQVRGGSSIGYISKNDEWDFNNQQFIPVNAVIKPGDELITRCSWDTTSKTQITLGGEDSSREMCYVFIFYYPKLPTVPVACET